MLCKNDGSRMLRLSIETLATLKSKEPHMAMAVKTKQCDTRGCNTVTCATYGCTHTMTCY